MLKIKSKNKKNNNEPKPEYSFSVGLLIFIGAIVAAMVACIIVIVCLNK